MQWPFTELKSQSMNLNYMDYRCHYSVNIFQQAGFNLKLMKRYVKKNQNRTVQT